MKIEIENGIEVDDNGLLTLNTEIEHTIKGMKNRKSTGIDVKPIELFKCLNEETIEEIVGIYMCVTKYMIKVFGQRS